MFSLTEIAKLQAAGYSLDDILAANTPAAAEDPVPAPAPAPAEDPAPAPAAAADPAPAADPMSAMTAKLDELIGAIRAGNIKAGGFPGPTSPEDNAQQVLASIINPPAKTGKK